MRNGTELEKGNGLFVLTRAVGVSDEFFTRGKEFVPERYEGAPPLRRGEGFATDVAVRFLCIASLSQLYLFVRLLYSPVNQGRSNKHLPFERVVPSNLGCVDHCFIPPPIVVLASSSSLPLHPQVYRTCVDGNAARVTYGFCILFGRNLLHPLSLPAFLRWANAFRRLERCHVGGGAFSVILSCYFVWFMD